MIIIFISIISIVLGLLHLLVYKALVSIFLPFSSYRLALGIILTTLCLSFVLASVLAFSYNNLPLRIYYTISATWLGFLFYFFLASCAYFSLFLVFKVIDINTSLEYFGILCFLIALILSVYGIFHARNFIVKNVSVPLSNLPEEWQGRKAVWISDVHLGDVHGQDYARNIVEKINKINPDIIFIGGDLYDGVKVNEAEIVKPFRDLHPVLGTYFITGNHEEFRDNKPYLAAIKNIGIRVLNNEMLDVGGIQLIGVDDRDSSNAVKFQAILSGLNININRPSILLKHQPFNLGVAAKARISFQISGHTHNAQLFPLNLLYRPIFKGYEYGFHMWDNMAVYTSSGVGTWAPPMRVGSDSEIVIFEFK